MRANVMRTNANMLPCRAVPAVENFLWNKIDEKISLFNTQTLISQFEVPGINTWEAKYRSSPEHHCPVVIATPPTRNGVSSFAAPGKEAGHVVRMDEDRTTKKDFNVEPIGTWRKGRPNLRWIDGIEKDVQMS
ncbi:hypothetical protein TNCV_88701 [Trichonephila clavipes]|nr:hypothetical protein TNCV_88701 [Trichonephila clavipes]